MDAKRRDPAALSAKINYPEQRAKLDDAHYMTCAELVIVEKLMQARYVQGATGNCH